MKRKDIKNCALCGKGIAHAGIPLFYVLKIQRFGLNAQAINQQAGLEQYFGGGSQGAVLANVMGADPDIAKPINENESEVWICEPCSTEDRTIVARLYELALEASEQDVSAGNQE